MSDDNVPLCAILIPAPWQVQGLKEDTAPWGEHSKSGLFSESTVVSTASDTQELYWVREKTPLSERSEELADGLKREDSITEEIPKKTDTRLPAPNTDTWDLDLWDSDED